METRSEFQFSMPLRVRYAETDAQAIVYFSNYLIYFDTAVYEFFKCLPYDMDSHIKETGADFHIVHADADYFGPSRFDDALEICVKAGKIGRASLTFVCGAFCADSLKLLARGQMVWVNTDQVRRKSTPLPGKLVDMLHRHDPALSRKP